MVQHRRRDGSTYWELPGGGLHGGENAEAGALRELFEETGLHGRVVRWLFSIPYRNGSSSTFLVEIDEGAAEMLGSDPEEAGQEFYKLIGVAWRSVSEAQESPEVRTLGIVLSYLDRLNERDESESKSKH
jgi:8-oxo-dGTP pyrophosphatase MutT (NUDIX family)